jgi:hypothetical protein
MPALIAALGLGADAFAVIALLIAVAAILGYATLASTAGSPRPLRPITAYRRLRRLADQAAESGRPIHVALGAGPLSGPGAPEIVMGLTVLGYVARRAASYDQGILATTGDGATLAAAQGVVQRAQQQAGSLAAWEGQVQFIGPDPWAYAAGAAEATARSTGDRTPLAHALWGHWDAESLWLSQAIDDLDGALLGGAAAPAANALLYVSLDQAVVGEDLFAAGAYLDKRSHLGSLVTQDLLRFAIVVLIVVGVILSSVGRWG